MGCKAFNQFLAQPSVELLDRCNERLALRFADNTGLVVHQFVASAAGVLKIQGEWPLVGWKEGFQLLRRAKMVMGSFDTYVVKPEVGGCKL